MTSPAPLLVISGVPGAGKTRYTCDLEARGWIRIEQDAFTERLPSDELEALWLVAIGSPFDADVAAFAEATKRTAQPVVVEVGFHVPFLWTLECLRCRGARSWWFTGDRAACLRDWRQAHSPRYPDSVWQTQMAYIDAALPLIEPTYGANLLATNPASGRLSTEQIDARVQPEQSAAR